MAIAKPGDQNAVHELRLSIKQTKCCFDLVGSIADGFDAKHAYKPFKKLYKAIAPYRDAAMISMAMDKYLSPTQQTRIVKATVAVPDVAAYETLFSGGQVKDLKKKAGKALHGVKAKKQMDQYYERLNGKIIKILAEPKTKRYAELHKLRKKLKEMYYNRAMLYEYADPTPPKKELEAWLLPFSELLGEWHDLRTLQLEIEKEIGLVIFTKRSQATFKIMQKLKAEEQALRKKVDTRCKTPLSEESSR